jgi:hypothetical protein
VEQETGACDQDDDLLRGMTRLDDIYTAGDGIDQAPSWNVWDSNSKGDQAYFFSRHEKCECCVAVAVAVAVAVVVGVSVSFVWVWL